MTVTVTRGLNLSRVAISNRSGRPNAQAEIPGEIGASLVARRVRTMPTMNLLRLASFLSILAVVGCGAEPGAEESTDEGAVSVLDGRPEDALDVALRLAPTTKSCDEQRKLLAALQFTRDRGVYWEKYRHWDGWPALKARIQKETAFERAVGSSLNYWAIIDVFDGTIASVDRLLQTKDRVVRIFLDPATPNLPDTIELSAESAPAADADVEGLPARPTLRRATAFTQGVASAYTLEINDRIELRTVDGRGGISLAAPRRSDWALQIHIDNSGEARDLPYWWLVSGRGNYLTVPKICPAR